MASSFPEHGDDEYGFDILSDADIDSLCQLLEQSASNLGLNDSSDAASPQASGQEFIPETHSISPSSSFASKQTSAKVPPILRFRTKPKTPLSVTDLISGAWCEIQYEYTLETYGRKPSTSVMRRGTELHKTLEKSLHESVEIEVTSKEEGMALRLFNSIMRLRTLQAEGIAREFEVWGIVEGEVVHGVIDELTTVRPVEAGAQGKDLSHQTDSSEAQETSSADRIVYVCDVKSRRSRRLPNDVSFRPTFLQLSLYRRLLVDMVEDTVNMDGIFDRYGLDYDQPLSRQFIDQMGPVGSPDLRLSGSTVTLSVLGHELIRQLRYNLPRGERSIGTTLKAEYRDQVDGEVFGVKIFDYDPELIESYVRSQMAFWTGNREAAGPPVEEAFKCSLCEFAEGCGWRRSQHLHRSRRGAHYDQGKSEEL